MAFTAQSARRENHCELAIKWALGASRNALALRALTEVFLLACAGSILALLLAHLVLCALVYFAPPDIPRLGDVHLNLDVLLFSLAISLGVMMLAAALPVWRATHVHPASVLGVDDSRGTETQGSLRLRNIFIIAEIALTLMLSVGAILLAQQLITQSRQDLGFEAAHLLVLDTHTILSTPEDIPSPNPPNSSLRLVAARTARLHASSAPNAFVPFCSRFSPQYRFCWQQSACTVSPHTRCLVGALSSVSVWPSVPIVLKFSIWFCTEP